MTNEDSLRVNEYLVERVGDDLRSVVAYERESYDVVYLRDDVSALYTEEDLVSGIDQSRWESYSAPIYSETFAEDHGDLTCMAIYFETVVEFNFVLGDDRGIAVGLDIGALSDTGGLVSDVKGLLLESQPED